MGDTYQQRWALTPGEAQANVGKILTERSQVLEMLLNITLNQSEQAPWQVRGFDTHAAVLEFGLLGQRVECRLREAVDAALEKAVAPMHG
ncbi:hypothetical protein D3C80_1785030 [compost metagenome]